MKVLTILSILMLCCAGIATAQRASDAASYSPVNAAIQQQGLENVRAKAAAGDAVAQNLLSLGYLGGGLLPQDDAKAAEWSIKSASQDYEPALTTLGMLYFTGRGVPKDYSKAVGFWRKAAVIGSVDAAFNLGEAYSDGRGVERSRDEAAKWYRVAAEKGEPDSQYHLGMMYLNGNGVPQDSAKAIEWLRKSAAQGFPDAKSALSKALASVESHHEMNSSPLSYAPSTVDKDLESAAEEYEGQIVDRYIAHDIAFPADIDEYAKLGGNAVMLVVAVSHDKSELPLARVYFKSSKSEKTFEPIRTFEDVIPANSKVAKVLGTSREHCFVLVPLSLLEEKNGGLYADFVVHRKGFQLSEVKGKIPVHFKVRKASKVNINFLNEFLAREFPVN